MAIEPNRPQTIGQVLDTSLELFKQLLMRLWWLFVPLGVLALLPMTYVLLKAPSRTMLGIAAAEDSTYFILAMIVGLCSLWVYAVTTLCAVEIARDEPVKVKAAMIYALRKWPIQLVVLICCSLIMMVGFLLLLVPGLIFSVSLSIAYLPTLLEGKSPFGALARSHRLIWGNWWRVFAIFSVGMLIWAALYVAVAAIIGGASALLAVGDAGFNAFLGTALGSAVMNLTTVPFVTAIVLAIYWDVKTRKEGADIAERIDALPAAASVTA